LNPISDDAFNLIKDIVKEATQTFPDTIYHTSGDEINTPCWDIDAGITAYTKQHNVTSKQLWFDWTNKLLSYINMILGGYLCYGKTVRENIITDM
jgi:hexosaminidase